jgi:hypothetical protein
VKHTLQAVNIKNLCNSKTRHLKRGPIRRLLVCGSPKSRRDVSELSKKSKILKAEKIQLRKEKVRICYGYPKLVRFIQVVYRSMDRTSDSLG